MKRRVVITGLGFVTPVGQGVDGFWNGILAGRSAIRRITRFDPYQYRAQCAGEVSDFDAGSWFAPHQLKRVDRYAQMAMVVSAQALEDAGLMEELARTKPRSDVGVSFGTALGGIANAETQHAQFLAEGPDAIPPALALQVFGGSAHSNIMIALGLRGYGTTNSNSCASGTVSVGEAFRVIQEGTAEVMIAGASEAPLAPLTFGAFDVIKSMSAANEDPSRACRPFDRNRSGFVMAEGAAALILESEEHAKKRGARVYAEVLGYALNNDAYHMTSSLPDGAAAVAAMQLALTNAGREPVDIDYLNAHASSTPMNDRNEAGAIVRMFPGETPPVSGTKAYYGHSLGAAGAIEAGLCALAMQHQVMPPTLNCEDPDIPGGFRLVTGAPQARPLRHIMSNSFGFGGINAVLVLGKAD